MVQVSRLRLLETPLDKLAKDTNAVDNNIKPL